MSDEIDTSLLRPVVVGKVVARGMPKTWRLVGWAGHARGGKIPVYTPTGRRVAGHDQSRASVVLYLTALAAGEGTSRPATADEVANRFGARR